MNLNLSKKNIPRIFLALIFMGSIFYLISFDYENAWKFLTGNKERNHGNGEMLILWPPKSIFAKNDDNENQQLRVCRDLKGGWGADSDGDGMPDIWERRYGLYDQRYNTHEDADDDGLIDYHEYLFGTKPFRKDSDNDGLEDHAEILKAYDPASKNKSPLEVSMEIRKMGIVAPIIWTESEKEEVIMEDLRKGVSHYYQSAAPGQKGNMIITGHSSNYVWEKGDYNYIFRKLNILEIGDMMDVYIKQKDGNRIRFSYVVKDKYVTTADDQRIFEETDDSIVTLITCWPLGTDYKRLIVKAGLEVG